MIFQARNVARQEATKIRSWEDRTNESDPMFGLGIPRFDRDIADDGHSDIES
jgi:hypothetical protein